MTLTLARRPAATVIATAAEAIAVAQSVATQLARDSIARDRDRKLPQAEMALLSASGLLAIGVPREYGGAGASIGTIAEVIRILSTGDAAIGQLPQNHYLFVEAIVADGSDEQKAFFFAELLGGARFGNAQAERGSASALNLTTRLTPDGDGYRLDGTKYYCTGAILADWIPVAAIDPDDRHVVAYVRRDADGVEVLPDWNAMGQRTTFSGTSHFRNVRVTAQQVIPHWRIFERPNVFHPFGVLLHAAVDVGIARNAFDDLLGLLRARQRPRLGAPVASALDDPHLLTTLGDLAVQVRGLEALLAEAGSRLDLACAAPLEDRIAAAAIAAGAVKALAEDVGLAITSNLFALVGSSAIDSAQGLDRHWRNLRTHSVHDANQWHYHKAGAWLVSGTSPGRPVRRAVGSP